MVLSGTLENLFHPHIDSFNYFIETGLSEAVQNLEPFEFQDGNDRLKFWFRDLSIVHPHENDVTNFTYPYVCRIRGTTYNGKLIGYLEWSLNGIQQPSITRVLGSIPIMVKSNRCNLKNKSESELVKLKEEASEQGGYFICAGIERVLRLLIVQRRNYPLATTRSTWKMKSSGLTEYGVSLRSVDKITTTNILHYNNNSTFSLSISYKKQQFFIPFLIVLKILVNYSEFEIFNNLIVYNKDNSMFHEAIKCQFVHLRDLGILSQRDAKIYIGEAFKIKLGRPDWETNEQVAEFLIKFCIIPHLESSFDKYSTLVFMAHKLMAMILNEISVESTDSLNNQEVVLPGQVYQMVLIDKIESWFKALRIRMMGIKRSETTLAHVNSAISRCPDIGEQMEYFIKSGNITSRIGLGLPQINGFSVIADKLNYIRYLSHFRSVHRGSYFVHSYSTKVRKLLPESWGFLCPVHTPDGSPCGLLNHLTQSCSIVTRNIDTNPYLDLINNYLSFKFISDIIPEYHLSIIFDGCIYGFIRPEVTEELYSRLIKLKVSREDYIEIVSVGKEKSCLIFPAIYIFSNMCRFVRPVHNIKLNSLEYIGSFEQIFLSISCGEPGNYTHSELSLCSMLSITASLTPFSEYNQSPRNMYQCQMMKQSMGVPLLSHKYRFDNKLYRLTNSQKPICHNEAYDKIGLNSYPIGFNAVIAVISYTGYDMEDAIIINKAALERGFGSGSVYKTIRVDLRDEKMKDKKIVFWADITDPCVTSNQLGKDGLPFVGSLIKPNEPFYSTLDIKTEEFKIKYNKLTESAYVDDIAIIFSDPDGIQCVSIRLRIPRNPVVGDKFSSRHGQKGILSVFWPYEDMPFSESGIVPDIIFNPHGFPSRMTIGMMIEIMASKAGAMNGEFFDSSPFQGTESIVDYYGDLLQKAGFNYYGSERMYSGTLGEELEANIFTGIVYYQRLRHMVSDKFQVRTRGPVDVLTHQPVGGRVRGGGVRFGEMERDCMISHGCSFLLKDRLFDCSDKTLSFVCEKCGDLLSTKFNPERNYNPNEDFKPLSVELNVNTQQYICLLCNSSAYIKPIYIPYVLRYLLVELASMNIKLKFEFES